MTDAPEFEVWLGGGIRFIVPLANMRSALNARGWIALEELSFLTGLPGPRFAEALPTSEEDEASVGRSVQEKLGPTESLAAAVNASLARQLSETEAERDAAIRERDETRAERDAAIDDASIALEAEDALVRAIDEALPYVEGSISNEPHGPDHVARVYTLRRQRDELREKLAAWGPIVQAAVQYDEHPKSETHTQLCRLARALKPEHRPDECEREKP